MFTPLQCRQDFFVDEAVGVCVPSCYTWTQFSHEETIVHDVVAALAAIFGFLAGLFVVAVSLYRFRKM